MTTLIDSYAAQCWKCLKVRYVESQEKYEDIRSETPEKSFECRSCEEPGDVVVDFDSPDVRWFQDRHGIPKTPQRLKRILVVRRSGEKADVYYQTEAPKRKRLKCFKDVTKFIEDNEQFKDMKIEEVSFAAPKRMKNKKSK